MRNFELQPDLVPIFKAKARIEMKYYYHLREVKHGLFDAALYGAIPKKIVEHLIKKFRLEGV